MKRTRNEISNLVFKAARGAGVALGVAEDLGQAAPFMDQGAMEELYAVLASPDQHSRLVDLCYSLDQRSSGVGGGPPGFLPGLYGAMCSAQDRLAPPQGLICVQADFWGDMSALVALTFVPESDASRQRGAGADMNDND